MKIQVPKRYIFYIFYLKAFNRLQITVRRVGCIVLNATAFFYLQANLPSTNQCAFEHVNLPLFKQSLFFFESPVPVALFLYFLERSSGYGFKNRLSHLPVELIPIRLSLWLTSLRRIKMGSLLTSATAFLPSQKV